MAAPKKTAGKVETWVRRRVLGPDEVRKPLSDEDIRNGVEGGDRRG